MFFNGYSEINYVEDDEKQTEIQRIWIEITDKDYNEVCGYEGYIGKTEFRKLYSEKELRNLVESVHEDDFEFHFSNWEDCESIIYYDKDEKCFILETTAYGNTTTIRIEYCSENIKEISDFVKSFLEINYPKKAQKNEIFNL